MTGVGGAYVAVAEGTEGSAANAAAPAVRTLYSTTFVDWDLSVGVSFPGAFTTTDFDNHGDDPNLPPSHANTGNYADLNLGGTLQFGELGVAATGDLQQYSVSTSAPGQPALTLQIGRWNALAAYGFYGGQLAVGGGARIVTMQILQNGAGSLLAMTGASPEVGALLMPTGQRWRIGATARAIVSCEHGREPALGQQIVRGGQGATTACASTPGARCVGGFFVPGHIVMPWEVEAGLAYQIGPRPLNPGWPDPRLQEAALRREIARDRAERRRRDAAELARLAPELRARRAAELEVEEKSLRAIEDDHLAEESERLRAARKARYANWPRERILLLASVLLTGQSPNAVSVEGFLDELQETVGRKVSATPRLGLEGAPNPRPHGSCTHRDVRRAVALRAAPRRGSTSRSAATCASSRSTPGGSCRTRYGRSASSPTLAPRYTNWGFGLGNWH